MLVEAVLAVAVLVDVMLVGGIPVVPVLVVSVLVVPVLVEDVLPAPSVLPYRDEVVLDTVIVDSDVITPSDWLIVLDTPEAWLLRVVDVIDPGRGVVRVVRNDVLGEANNELE